MDPPPGPAGWDGAAGGGCTRDRAEPTPAWTQGLPASRGETGRHGRQLRGTARQDRGKPDTLETGADGGNETAKEHITLQRFNVKQRIELHSSTLVNESVNKWNIDILSRRNHHNFVGTPASFKRMKAGPRARLSHMSRVFSVVGCFGILVLGRPRSGHLVRFSAISARLSPALGFAIQRFRFLRLRVF